MLVRGVASVVFGMSTAAAAAPPLAPPLGGARRALCPASGRTLAAGGWGCAGAGADAVALGPGRVLDLPDHPPSRPVAALAPGSDSGCDDEGPSLGVGTADANVVAGAVAVVAGATVADTGADVEARDAPAAAAAAPAVSPRALCVLASPAAPAVFEAPPPASSAAPAPRAGGSALSPPRSAAAATPAGRARCDSGEVEVGRGGKRGRGRVTHVFGLLR